MLDEPVRERDEARTEVARLRSAIADGLVVGAADGGERSGSRVVAVGQARAAASDVDSDLASPPSYGVIALACERARQEALAEARGLD